MGASFIHLTITKAYQAYHDVLQQMHIYSIKIQLDMLHSCLCTMRL